MPRLQTYTRRRAPSLSGAVTPEAFGAAQGRGARVLGQGIEQTGRLAQDTGQFVVREQEERAAVSAAQYELELRNLQQELEQIDHNQRGEVFRERSKELRDRYGQDFSGTAAQVFRDQSDLATRRSEILLEEQVWKDRIDARRGSLLEYADTMIEAASSRPRKLHGQYLTQIYERLELAKREQLLPADEVARLKMWSRNQITNRHEDIRVAREADQAVSRALEARAMSAEMGEDGISDQEILASFDNLSARAKPIALREFKRRIATEDYLRDREQEALLDQGYEAILNGEGTAGIPTGLSGSNRAKAHRLLEWHTDRLAEGQTTEIRTDPDVYDRLMTKLASADKQAFLSEDLYAERLHLSDEDYRYFLGAQKELRALGPKADASIYKGDVRWQAKNLMTQMQEQGHLDTPEERAVFERAMRDALDTAIAQKREREGPTATLSTEEIDTISNRVLVDTKVTVPGGAMWGLIDWKRPPREMEPDDVDAVLNDPEHEFRAQVYDEMVESGRYEVERLDMRDWRVTERMRDILEQLGAPVDD